MRYAVLFFFCGCLLGQPTTVTLTPSTVRTSLGQPLTLTATISQNGLVPPSTGLVTFYDGVSILGIRALNGARAVMTTSLLQPGVRSLYAYFGGGGAYVHGTSPPVMVNVTPVPANSFLMGWTYPAIGGDYPAIALGDFNGDDRADIALVNNGDSVMVFLGKPDGTFGAPASYPGGSYLWAVNVGDFNGDGKADLAVIGSNGASVLLGKGDGTFQAPRTACSSSSGNTILVADFNADGKADLLEGVVLLGNGDATFQVAGNSGCLGTSGQVVADFNGDGKPDLAYVSFDEYFGTGVDGVFVALGNGDGTFQPGKYYPAGIDSYTVATGDFNGDGKPDLAVGNLDSSVSVFLGNGDGTFRPAVNYAAGAPGSGGAGNLAVVDLNGDGRLDLVVTSGTGLVVLSGNGDGTFRGPVSFAEGSVNSATAIAAGDFNGDGRTDFLFIASGALVELLGTAIPATTMTLLSSPNPSIAGQPVSLTATVSSASGPPGGTVAFYADGPTLLGSKPLVNGQATISFSILSLGSHSLNAVYSGTSGFAASYSPILTHAVNRAAGVSTTSLISSANPSTAGQILTLSATVTPSTATGPVTFYDGTFVLGSVILANGKAFLSASQLTSGAHSITAMYTGDLNYAPSSSAVIAQQVRPVPAGGFQPYTGWTLSSISWVLAADFNGDGILDLAVDSLQNGDNYAAVYLGKGDGSFQLSPNFMWPGVLLAVADFNRDGKADLAILDANSSISILPGNGNGTFQLPVKGPSVNDCCATIVGDFNGDGKPDLLVGAYVLLGNGDGTLQPPINSRAFGAAQGDFNGDGKTDLAFLGSENLTILLGNGDGTFYPPSRNRTEILPYNVVVADFNGDGKADIAFSTDINNAEEIAVFLGNGDGTFQSAGYISVGVTAVPFHIVAGDLNGDGKIDLAAAVYGYNSRIFYGNGDGSFSGPVSVTGPATTILLADLNNDGRPDLVVTNQDGRVSILLAKPSLAGAKMPGTRVGVYRNGLAFLEDSNGNTAYDPGVDRYIPSFTGPGGFVTGDMPVVGDWTGDGNSKVGIYRSSTGTWFLDANNNGIFDAGDYQYQFGGLPGDLPFAGDWTGRGINCIGIYRSAGSVWLLDLNCDGRFDNAPNDAFFPFGGVAGDVPVVGAWTGTTTRVGVVRKYAPAGIPQGDPFYWVLDSAAANAGTMAAKHQPAFAFPFGGMPGDLFVTGDWYNNGISVAGVYRAGFWVLDSALPSAPAASHTPGLTFGYGGLPRDVPVTGKW